MNNSKQYISFRSINEVICPLLSRAALNSLVDKNKVVSIKMGDSKAHNRLYLLIDVVRCCRELGLLEKSDPNVLTIELIGANNS